MRFRHSGRKTLYQGQFPSGKESIRIFPVGGTGNVTKNMYAYEYLYDGDIRDILLVDCGIGFPEADMYGVDLIIPDVRYLEDKKAKIRGLVFTHGHDDHVGGIQYVYPKLGKVPMWGTKLTATFANLKLKERKMPAKVSIVEFGEELRIGPFSVRYSRITHSIPDAATLVIDTPIGRFVHAADFKFDFTPLDGKKSDIDALVRAGEKPVICLLTDCLGSERRGFTSSEQVVGEGIEKELRLCTGKFLFTTQSSNVSRIQLAVDKAIAAGRNIAFFGRSMDQNTEACVDIGYMRIPRERVLTDRDLKRTPPEKQFLIVAGAQGQPESALTRMANDAHRTVRIEEGDSVMFSADPIPGNEVNINGLIEQIYRKGARVAYSDIMEDIHVSGHGSQGDLMLMLSLIGPRYIMPIGGQYRHIMQYRRLVTEMGYRKDQVLIPDEGDIIEFRDGAKPRIADQIDLENVMVDGLGIGDVGAVVLRDRRTIATEGIVVVVLPIEKRSGRLAAPPDIISRGFVYIKESGDLLEKARNVTRQAATQKKGVRMEWQYLRKEISEQLGSFLYKETGRSPLIVPVIVEV